jgi:hypothetical protein
MDGIQFEYYLKELYLIYKECGIRTVPIIEKEIQHCAES